VDERTSNRCRHGGGERGDAIAKRSEGEHLHDDCVPDRGEKRRGGRDRRPQGGSVRKCPVVKIIKGGLACSNTTRGRKGAKGARDG